MAAEPLVRMDRREITLRPQALLAFMCVRNESLRLPYALTYYRRLGIEEFFIVENNSTDDTLAWLLEQPDVHVWQAVGSFREARCGTDWVELLMRDYGVGHWCLVVDPDELLYYADLETRSLAELCADLDASGKKAFFAILLDMYSDRPIKDTHYQRGEDFFNACRFFDRQFYHFKTDHFFGHDEHPSYFGGLRQRVFGGAEPGKDEKHFYCVNKIPLVKYDRSFRFSDNLHWTNCRAVGDETGCLLHFKYFSPFLNSAREEMQRKEHWNHAIQYAQYARVIEENPDLTLFSNEHSVRFRDSRHLVELGIMRDKGTQSDPSVTKNGESAAMNAVQRLDPEQPASANPPSAPRLMGRVRDLIRAHKSDGGHPHLTGVELLKAGKIEEAEAAFRLVIELYPQFSWAHHYLGEVLALRKKRGEALAAFRRAIELNPYFAMSHSNLGDLLMKDNQTEEAIAAYRKAIELQPDLVATIKSLARALVAAAQSRIDEAKDWYRRAHRLNPDDTEVYSEAVNLRPIDPALCVQFADALLARHQSTKAVFFYQLALMATPDDADALVKLARALKAEKERDQAMACCRRAIALDPNHSAGHRLLGDLLADAGRLTEAVDAYRRASELDPASAELVKRLGDLLAQQGRVDEAGAAYQRAIELGYKSY